MSWVRLDDAFTEHPKVLAAGPLAGWVHVCGLCYCNRNLTDGFVPRSVAHRLEDFNNPDWADGKMANASFAIACHELVDDLVAAGLWSEVPGGYQIHDYLDYNPSRADVFAKRDAISKARSDAGKKGAAKRWDSKRYGKTDGNPDSKPTRPKKRLAAGPPEPPMAKWQTDGPEPVPLIESSNELSPEPAPKKPRPRDDLWDAFAEALGQPTTRSERGRRNKAVKEIREIGGTPDEVTQAARRYKLEWPDIALTDTALAANWSRFKNGGPGESSAERFARRIAEHNAKENAE